MSDSLEAAAHGYAAIEERKRNRTKAMTEPSVEEIVARLERELDLRGEATLLANQLRAFIASWRERGERADAITKLMLEPLPCDVGLPPATTLHKGVSFATLWAALDHRARAAIGDEP